MRTASPLEHGGAVWLPTLRHRRRAVRPNHALNRTARRGAGAPSARGRLAWFVGRRSDTSRIGYVRTCAHSRAALGSTNCCYDDAPACSDC